MAQRLTNDELAERVRASNRRRGERHRQRLTVAGRAALTVWVPVELRSRFVDRAAELLININELAERLIDAGLRAESKTAIIADMPEPDPQSETADLFAMPDPEPQTLVVADVDPDPQATPPTVSVNSDRDGLLRQVGLLLADGLSGAEIARRMNAAGHRAISGKELVGHNLLREYRAWRDKTDGTVKTAV